MRIYVENIIVDRVLAASWWYFLFSLVDIKLPACEMTFSQP
jgi:hypothetical protein